MTPLDLLDKMTSARDVLASKGLETSVINALIADTIAMFRGLRKRQCEQMGGSPSEGGCDNCVDKENCTAKEHLPTEEQLKEYEA